MIVVLDASGAAEIAVKTQPGIDFINILMRSEKVVAPDLYIAEISNVMWKLTRMDKAGSDVCLEMANDCIGYIDEYANSAELWKEALRLARDMNHSVYDMLYAVLARRNDALLLTMDAKLGAVCEKISVRYKTPDQDK